MTPTRRSLVLAAAFLGFAVTLADTRPARARQDYRRKPGQNTPQFPPAEPFSPTVSPDQAREAFRRAGQPEGGSNPQAPLPEELERLVPGLTKEFQKQFPDLDPSIAEPAVRQLLADPRFQNRDPQRVDSEIRSILRNEIARQQIRDAVKTAKSNPSNAKTVEEPKPMTPGNRRPGGPPPNSEQAPPRYEPAPRPNDGTKYPPGDGPSKAITDPGKAGPPNVPSKVGPGASTPDGPRVNPTPKVGPIPEPPLGPEPEPRVGPEPGPKTVTDPKPGSPEAIKFGPGGDGKVNGPGDRLPPGKSPFPKPTDPPAPTPPDRRNPAEQPPPKFQELGEGFRPPGSPDPNESPEQVALRKRRQAAAAMWEKSVGPLDETPAVKRALFDLVDESGDLKDGEGNSFWDGLTKDGGEGTSFADWVDRSAGGDTWKLDFGWGGSDNTAGGSSSSSGDSWWSRNFGGSSSSSSSSSSRSGSSGGFDFGSGGSGGWLPLLLLAALLIGGLLAWKLLYFRTPPSAAGGFDLSGLGPWPVDPRAISTREELVKAFEYLSVMICGPAARMWTHGTIAAALADLATTHSEAAMILARLYELARYAPLDEPLTRAEIGEARRLVCGLAGVSYP
jgi:hypothetical protein